MSATLNDNYNKMIDFPKLNFPQKVQKIRENITNRQKEYGSNEFDYLVNDFYLSDEKTNEQIVLISGKEHSDILRYINSKGQIDLEEKANNNWFYVKILPLKEAIKTKTLELIAKELKEYYSGTGIVDLLNRVGVDKRFIIYPESKWVVFFTAFNELSISQNPQDKDLLYKLIAESIHPLNLNGNTELSNILVNKFNEYLKFNNLEIYYDERKGIYSVSYFPSDNELDEMYEEVHHQEQEEIKRLFDFLAKPENRDKLSLLRKSFQTLMSTVEVFCQSPYNPTTELNNTYQFLKKTVLELIEELGLKKQTITQYYKFKDYTPPFINLFAAENQYKQSKKELSWDKIRPEMNSMYGEIDELFQQIKGSDILAEPDKQKELNRINLYLSELKEKSEIDKKEKQQIEAASQAIPIKIVDSEIIIKKDKPKPKHNIEKDNLLLTKDLKADITTGKLSSYSDGTIRYGNSIIEMRNQLKDLCRFFMRNSNRLLTLDDIKDQIIHADRRTLTSFVTIAKYVSELHSLLKIHFGQDVIFNQKEEGWFFRLPK